MEGRNSKADDPAATSGAGAEPEKKSKDRKVAIDSSGGWPDLGDATADPAGRGKQRNVLQRAASYDVSMMKYHGAKGSLGTRLGLTTGLPNAGSGSSSTSPVAPALVRAASAPAVMMRREQFFNVLNRIDVNVENRVNAASTISAALRQQFDGSRLKTIHEEEDAAASKDEQKPSEAAAVAKKDPASSADSASAAVAPEAQKEASADTTQAVEPEKKADAPPAKPEPDVVPFTADELKSILDTVRHGRTIPQAQARDILERSIALFDYEPSVLYVDGPNPYKPKKVCLMLLTWLDLARRALCS